MASVEYPLEVVHLFRLHKVGGDDGGLVPVPEALEEMALAVPELVLGKAYLRVTDAARLVEAEVFGVQ